MRYTFAYDIEVLPNFFSVIFVNIEDENDTYTFIVSEERNDSGALKQFISQPNLRLVGYNSRDYDNIVLNRFLEDKPVTNDGLYKISKAIIEGDRQEYPRWLKRLKWSLEL